MGIVFKNNAKTTLASGITDTATSATVVDGSVFPTLGAGEYFFCTFDTGTQNEIVKVTARSGNTLTIVRAQDNTTARSFLSGHAAELRVTAGVLENIQENIAAKSANQTIYSTTTASSATSYDIGIDPGVEANASVFLDGVYQHHDTFSFSGSTLTFDAAPVDGTALEVIVDNLINLQSSNLSVDTFTAADVGGNPQTDFTLSDVPGAETNLIVFVDGVFQNQDSYTFSNNTLTMTDGVTADRVVTVYIINPVNIGTPSDGTITSAKLSGDITFPGDITVTGDVAFDSPTFVVDNANSRVGIGTAAPSTLLDIVGDVKMSADLTVDTSTLHVDSANNRVGIGTASPNTKLDISGNVALNASTVNPWRSSQTIIQLNEVSTLTNYGSVVTSLEHNSYIDSGGTRRYIVSGQEAYNIALNSYSNGIIFQTAAAGTAGDAVSFSEKFRITTGGNVGINTTNVTNLLTIGLDSFSTGAADTSGIYTDSTSKFLSMLSDGYTWNTRAGTERMRIDSSGNVGIGTTSPNYVLNTNYNANATFTNAASDFTQMWQNSGTNALGVALSDDLVARLVTNNSYEFAIGSSTTEQLRIDGGGRVGIGTDNPQEILHASSGSNPALHLTNTDGTNGGTIRIVAATNGAFIGLKSPSGTFDALRFGTGNEVERMRIDSSGNVGIGTGGPQEKLHIEGSVLIDAYNQGAEEGLFFRQGFSSSNKYNMGIMTYAHNGSSNDGITIGAYNGFSVCTGSNTRSEKFRIDSTGNVLVNTTSAFSSGKLDVQGGTNNTVEAMGVKNNAGGSYNVMMKFFTSSGAVGRIDWDNTGGFMAFTNLSDGRLKNVTGEARGLDLITKLNPVKYYFKDNDWESEGLVAQEVEQAYQDLGDTPVGVRPPESDEDYYQLSTSHFVVNLIKAVKEQQEQIEQLKGRIEELENG